MESILKVLFKSLFRFRFQGLSIDDLEDLLADITVYLEMDQEKNIDFWEVCVI